MKKKRKTNKRENYPQNIFFKNRENGLVYQVLHQAEKINKKGEVLFDGTVHLHVFTLKEQKEDDQEITCESWMGNIVEFKKTFEKVET